MFGLVVVLRSFGRIVRRLVKDQETRGLAVLAMGLIGGGTLFYRATEGFGWIDSLYFTVVTLTTVGYGDLHPETTVGKVFTVFYLLIGVGVLVAFLTLTARHLVRDREERAGADGQS